MTNDPLSHGPLSHDPLTYDPLIHDSLTPSGRMIHRPMVRWPPQWINGCCSFSPLTLIHWYHTGPDSTTCSRGTRPRRTKHAQSAQDDPRVGQVLQTTVWRILDPLVDRSDPLLRSLLYTSHHIRRSAGRQRTYSYTYKVAFDLGFRRELQEQLQKEQAALFFLLNWRLSYLSHDLIHLCLVLSIIAPKRSWNPGTFWNSIDSGE